MAEFSTYEEELRKNGKIIHTNVGTSMMPLLRQNRDVMIIERPEGRLKRYDVPLYKRKNGQYVLHRILKVRERDYVICGDHCVKKEYGITDDDIIGVLTGVIRDGKTITMDAPLYKFYYHLWCDFFYIRVAILKFKFFIRRCAKFILTKIFKIKIKKDK